MACRNVRGRVSVCLCVSVCVCVCLCVAVCLCVCVRRVHHEERIHRPDPTPSAQVRRSPPHFRLRRQTVRAVRPLLRVSEPHGGRGGARFDGVQHRPAGADRIVRPGRRREAGSGAAVVPELRRPHRREQLGQRPRGPALQRQQVGRDEAAGLPPRARATGRVYDDSSPSSRQRRARPRGRAARGLARPVRRRRRRRRPQRGADGAVAVRQGRLAGDPLLRLGLQAGPRRGHDSEGNAAVS